MNKAVLLIGGNLGNRMDYLQKCCLSIELHLGKIISKSSIYETEAWGRTDQQDFLNQAVYIETPMQPLELLANCLEIEFDLDRTRKIRWGERTMDIDIIFYNDIVIQTPKLEIPHPRYHLRNFVLQPLAEIIPNYICPEFNLSVNIMMQNSKDKMKANLLELS